MSAVLLALIAFFSTLGGGLFALKFRNHLHFILSFTAGVLLGVVSFDILPEIFSMAAAEALSPHSAMVALVAGFLIFYSLEKIFIFHHVHGPDCHQYHPRIGVMSALALAGHSFMDGVGIGLGFQVSHSVGITVALAVIAHDFCDGLNTVGLMLLHRNSWRKSVMFLLLAATAPVLGALSTLFFQVPPYILLLYLGLFAGFLLYMAASSILPQVYAQKGKASVFSITALTCFGAAFIFTVVQLLE